MPLARLSAPTPHFARQAKREILLWTTRDGREIALDEMPDDHIANAVRVLTLWRSRLKKRGGDEDIQADLKAAIARFKALQRRRLKASPREKPSFARLAKPSHSSSPSSSPRPPSRLSRRRKPVAST